jgi:diguanylate cyclase (GGDEF)-like protein
MRVNDQSGQLAGDAVLRQLAARIRGFVEKDELFARFGGDEFALVLPGATLEEALTLAERARGHVASEAFTYEDQPINVTISLGVACTLGREGWLTPLELIRQAEEKLFQARSSGRNRVCG